MRQAACAALLLLAGCSAHQQPTPRIVTSTPSKVQIAQPPSGDQPPDSDAMRAMAQMECGKHGRQPQEQAGQAGQGEMTFRCRPDPGANQGRSGASGAAQNQGEGR
jgi:hypothetical protein